MGIDPDRFKCGDNVIVTINDVEHHCQVYGEVYRSINKKYFSRGPSHLAAIEVYINNQVYEIPVNEVIHENR
jgi:hypothetical protein